MPAYEPVIGLEIHAELATRSKMFCSCAVLDATRTEPNRAVCPVCAGMPGVLPVVNQQAVEYALRVALALGCTVQNSSLFARKNYFYPDLPKGYQISQYEFPLAVNGQVLLETSQGPRTVRIRRAHLEEDTGKLTHLNQDGQAYSLVDLNRAGVPLLEIVSEPDMHTLEEVRLYATQLRAILRELGVNSGDMEKGVIRFEANVSIRRPGAGLGTRTEIKNLNSFKIMEKAIQFELARQARLLDSGGKVEQETLGWNEASGETFSQRSKEEAHDYRYFPEPDLPPLVVEEAWVERVRAGLPELPRQRILRLEQAYGLAPASAGVLGADKALSEYFEAGLQAAPRVAPAVFANWILGEVLAWQNQSGQALADLKVSPARLGELLNLLADGQINQATAKAVLAEMLESGQAPAAIVQTRRLGQVSDPDSIAALVRQALQDSPGEVKSYLAGKETLANWFFGQVMRLARGQANPAVLRAELERQLEQLKSKI